MPLWSVRFFCLCTARRRAAYILSSLITRHSSLPQMSEAIQIRMGGYGPASTTCSRGMKIMGDALTRDFGKAVDVKYIWNVMDLGYKSGDLLWMADNARAAARRYLLFASPRLPDRGFCHGGRATAGRAGHRRCLTSIFVFRYHYHRLVILADVNARRKH